jgi:hypothetical protein
VCVPIVGIEDLQRVVAVYHARRFGARAASSVTRGLQPPIGIPEVNICFLPATQQRLRIVLPLERHLGLRHRDRLKELDVQPSLKLKRREEVRDAGAPRRTTASGIRATVARPPARSHTTRSPPGFASASHLRISIPNSPTSNRAFLVGSRATEPRSRTASTTINAQAAVIDDDELLFTL